MIDPDAQLPGGTRLLQPGRRAEAWVRLGTTGSQDALIRTLCMRLPDVYGPGRDQDFLLASSADGVPLHHVTLPASQPGSRLYSSLWLYLAGARPVLFGARATPDRPTRYTFLLSDVLGRFRPIGHLTLATESVDRTDLTFAAQRSGGGLRPLPPVTFYRA